MQARKCGAVKGLSAEVAAFVVGAFAAVGADDGWEARAPFDAEAFAGGADELVCAGACDAEFDGDGGVGGACPA